jgi:hypothetical protein
MRQIGKDLKGSSLGLILRYCPDIHLEGLKKPQNLCQDSRSLGRDLKPGPPEYEAGVLSIRPRRLVPYEQQRT